jgi:hypothetical protein
MILDDKKLYVLESFWRLADAYVRMDMEKEMNKPKGYRGLDKIEIYYNYDLKLGSMAAKEWAMNYELDDSVKVEALAEYMKIVKNEKFKKELKDLYEYFSDTEEDEIFTAEELMLEVDAFEDFDKKQAEPAVPFALKDANSKPYALSTFKGKYLYINIWSYLYPVSMLASHEMEALKKKFEGENIAFININADRDRTFWLQFISLYKLPGIQLYAGPEDPFIESLQLQFPSRFVIIDSAGNMIDDHAGWPSSKYTETYLRELLEQ